MAGLPTRREPAARLYRLVLPLPFPGLEEVNAYLLDDDEAPVLVDCGIRDEARPGEGYADLVTALQAHGRAPTDIARLVVTHTHIDHYGLAGRLVAETGCELWMHAAAREELQLYRDPEAGARRLKEMLADHGVAPGEIEELSAFEDWSRYVSGVVEPTAPLQGGETFAAGGRTWEVVHTPGHSRSHICLWSAGERLLISGDHLLASVTPHIDFERGGAEDPLGDFLTSLQKVEELAPALVLPGHGRPFEDGAQRARVIARHHDRRLGSILQVIRHEDHTAEEITEEIFGDTLLNFHKRLALGEVLAHLAHLRRNGEVERVESPDGTYRYRKVSRRATAQP